MSIKELFKTEDPQSPAQENWLKLVAAIPGAKQALNDQVSAADEAIAEEAQSILIQKNFGSKAK